ncbi:E3 UFM1-protein ligase 1 [Lingula anatina]|uniref:E3 UFM1-protein ligase 1 n=1 Tax=Lingula anatina TaxID=7574 RepID=A0A2R2MJ50_LINAN|nr:E3 UFM1-protein ligase 1 [Lingula anatina]XP_023930233.1 E3 UFM1-protein ligase 1 [Lingula anatina]|eukprot:XP_023930232.1 E3 UFM1-protein ligase 1 [Lingula anatina]
MADWEEVKRLAADFQRAQLSSTVQRLSERNCIEIVSKLIQLKLIDVIYTTDGKEYLTPQEISKEIREELIVHGGRVNLVELQHAINVDLSHIQNEVEEILKTDKNLTLVLGQLIDKDYLDRLAEEINYKLQEQGQVTIAELTKLYDLPADFLSEVIKERLGIIVQGQIDDFDRDVIFTETFVARQKAKIRGIFSAVTRPTPVMSIINQYHLPERLFYTILEDLVSSGRLAGSISGGRQDKASYIPDIYTRSQTEWVDAFYKQNGYLEYDSLSRLGISDPKGFLKKRYKGESLSFLSTCCAGTSIKDQLEATVDEALAGGTWTDVMPVLPSIFSRSDAAQLLQDFLKHKQGVHVFSDTIVASDKFISSCCKMFDKLMQHKAEKDSKLNLVLLSPDGDKKVQLDTADNTKEDRKEARRKKAAGGQKSGGGLQGREVKMKSTKKKGHYGRGGGGGHDEDSEDEVSASVSSQKGKPREAEFMKVPELTEVLKKNLKDCDEEFLTEVAQQIYRPLKRQYQEIAKSVFLQSSASSGTPRKKTQGELQEKLVTLWTNTKLFEKGIALFKEDVQAQLSKHLLKTICTDITNLIVNAIATDHMMSVSDETQLTPEMRVKIIGSIPEPSKSVLSKLHSSLNDKSLEVFYNQLDEACGPSHLGILLKKPDKKKERQLVFNHRQALAEQLRRETEPALVLHLACVVLIQTFTQTMLHAPGKCVPQILSQLKEYMTPEDYGKLSTFQDLVVKQLRQGSEDGEDEDISMQLVQLVPQVRELALTTKKAAATSKEPED